MALNLFPRMIIYCNATYPYSKDIPSSLLSGQCSEALIRKAAFSHNIICNCECGPTYILVKALILTCETPVFIFLLLIKEP